MSIPSCLRSSLLPGHFNAFHKKLLNSKTQKSKETFYSSNLSLSNSVLSNLELDFSLVLKTRNYSNNCSNPDYLLQYEALQVIWVTTIKCIKDFQPVIKNKTNCKFCKITISSNGKFLMKSNHNTLGKVAFFMKLKDVICYYLNNQVI